MQDEQEIFAKAIELNTPEERHQLIESACARLGLDQARVQRLVDLHFQTIGFMPKDPHERTTQMAQSKHTEEVGSFIGPYKLLQKIGEGGYGVVYMAEQQTPMIRRVALKIIKLGMDTKEVVARFEAERQALAMMDHPNIAKVLDAGATDSGRPFFVMELVRGVRITEYADKHKLNTSQRIRLVIDVCGAIQHAHQKGVIHRDIKPSNLLVTLHDHKAVPKVIDFGIAKATQQRLTDKTLFTRFHQFIGTPAYMSPEQAQLSGLDVDTRSDIYSIGILLYELITGTPPLDPKVLSTAGQDEIRRSILEEEPMRPSITMVTRAESEVATIASNRQSDPIRLNRFIKGDLDWIIMKAIEKDRNRRYETAGELAADLERFLINEPVSAAAPSTRYRFLKFARRNRVALSFSVTIALLLMAGALISTVLAVRARKAENEAGLAADQAEAQRVIAVTKGAQAEEERNRATAIAKELEENLYAADMNAAQQFLQQDNIAKVQELLDKHRPRSSPRDLRGFEWRFLWDRSRGQEQYRFPGHKEAVGAVEISPDGSTIASFGDDDRIHIWHLPSREHLAELSHDAKTLVFGLNLYFTPDGKYLIAGANHSRRWSRNLTVWSTVDWSLHATIKNAGFPVVALPSANERLLVTTNEGFSEMTLTDKEAAPKKLTTFSSDEKYLDGFALTPNSEILALKTDEIAIWDMRNLTRIHRWNKASGNFAIAPDYQRLAVLPHWRTREEDNRGLRLYDPLQDTEIPLETAQSGFLHDIEFSPDGRYLAAGGSDYLLHIWNPTSGQKVGTLKGHMDEIYDLKFAPDSHLLVSAGKDGGVYLWDLRSIAPNPEFEVLDFPEPLPVARGEDQVSPRYTPIFETLPSSLLTEFRTGNLDYFIPPKLAREGEAISPNGQYLASVVDRTSLEVRNAQTGRFVTTFEIDPRRGSPFNRPFIFAGNHHVLFRQNNRLFTWNLKENKQTAISAPDAYNQWRGASRDGQFLALQSSENGYEMIIWNRETKTLTSTLKELNSEPNAIHFSPSGDLAVATSWDKRAQIIRVSTGSVIQQLSGHKQAVLRAAFSFDQRTLATSSFDGTVRLWHLPTGREVLSFQPQYAGIRNLEFSKDNNLLLLSGQDKALLLRVPDPSVLMD